MRWARKLKLAGESVTLILRDQQKLHEFAAAGSGIRYLSHLGDEFVPFPATSLDDPSLQIDNLLLCTKSYSLTGAFEAVQGRCNPNATLVLLCNGYGVQQQVAARAESLKVWAASTTSGANTATPFHLTLAGDGYTDIGPLNLAEMKSQPPLTKLPRHRLSDDIETTLWRKVAVNACINPLTCIYQVSNGELLSHSEGYTRMIRVASEVERLADRLEKPLFDQPLVDIAAEVCRTTAINRSSMLQDRHNSRRSEIDHITGALLALAKKNQLVLSENQQLLREIQAIESHLPPVS